MVFISPFCCLVYNFLIKKVTTGVQNQWYSFHHFAGWYIIYQKKGSSKSVVQMVSLKRRALFNCSFIVSFGAQYFHQGVIFISQQIKLKQNLSHSSFHKHYSLKNQWYSFHQFAVWHIISQLKRNQ